MTDDQKRELGEIAMAIEQLRRRAKTIRLELQKVEDEIAIRDAKRWQIILLQ